MNNILAKREVAIPRPLEWFNRGADANGGRGSGREHCQQCLLSNRVDYIRLTLVQLVADLGIEAEEGRYSWEFFTGADEIFTTGSVQEIVPVTTLIGAEGEPLVIGQGLAGPITRTLLSAYRRKAGQKA